MKRTKPPFRADHVGSFLRPAALKEARAKREKGAITAAELKAVEDREIEKIIKKQEDIGLQLATDGEFRRSWWHFDFFSMLDGVELFNNGNPVNPVDIPLNVLRFTTDTHFKIPATTHIELGFGGQIQLNTQAATATKPPRNTDDSGK